VGPSSRILRQAGSSRVLQIDDASARRVVPTPQRPKDTMCPSRGSPLPPSTVA